MELHEYQRKAAETDKNAESAKGLLIVLLGLASEAGGLLEQYKKVLRDGQSMATFRGSAKTELGDVLWYLANCCTHLGHDAGDVAEMNLEKVRARYGAATDSCSVLLGELDQEFPEAERLPRRFTATFTATSVENRPTVLTKFDDETFGSPLNDNCMVDDGFRFHDAFHFGLAACLGWSPVLRRQIGRKRRSDKWVDDNEDGARAASAEEIVVLLMHNFGKKNGELVGLTQISSTFLEELRSHVEPHEVRVATASDWERAVLMCWSVYRSLRDYNGGTLIGDLDARSIAFRPPEEASEGGA